MVSVYVKLCQNLAASMLSDNVQDEIFHVPQAQQYCKGNFKSWDPMITTPPGLYALCLFRFSFPFSLYDDFFVHHLIFSVNVTKWNYMFSCLITTFLLECCWLICGIIHKWRYFGLNWGSCNNWKIYFFYHALVFSPILYWNTL